MDQKLFEKWLDGFVAEAEKAGYDESGTSSLLKIASRMQVYQKHPEAFEEGFNKKAGPIFNLRNVLSALIGAGLWHGGSVGQRGMRQYFGIMPGDVTRWEVGDITAQNQKIKQYMDAMKSLGFGGGSPQSMVPPMYSNPYLVRPWPSPV